MQKAVQRPIRFTFLANFSFLAKIAVTLHSRIRLAESHLFIKTKHFITNFQFEIHVTLWRVAKRVNLELFFRGRLTAV